MGKLIIPETVKVLKLSGIAGETLARFAVKWAMGKNEIAVLLAVRVIVDNLYNSTFTPTLQWALSKKQNAPLPTGLHTTALQSRGDVIISGALYFYFVTEGAAGGKMSEEFHFPYPIVFIRPGTFFTDLHVETACYFGAWFYYMTQEVSDKEMAELMVKNHA